ncbi:MAG: NAD-dependent epimerase/dehydratase family protein [Candidatus Nitrohelix vancouverensis]|uniref:NAD-dependent epimerase/dehydratase family protein n=1 Tax=Candidatus Nitrohelix vancouverensis TaxID=2705534 RepID=A0A7T0C161_9BACT|nr:MAG: NAD-dependent epimerase/dehydratase family protein [Candidatus Nitrohelix vancouverensis]
MILVTGAAGFIGYHLCRALLDRGDAVVGLDNLNDYYDVGLKKDRLERLLSAPNFSFHEADLCDADALDAIASKAPIRKICHLAAQVGVRYSLSNPQAYQKSNLDGFLNIIEQARKLEAENFVYASSSSVYGNNRKIPFSTDDRTDEPISFYAATKRANELTAHVYSHLYQLPVTGLRFFTVYGPWGRPDMAPFLFTKKILAGETIDVYGHGTMKRNFTYVDDIIQGVMLSLDRPQAYKLYNIGNDRTEELERFIAVIEEITGKKALRNEMDKQPGEMTETWADIEPIQNDLGYQPSTDIESGMKRFIDWYRDYYNIPAR